MGAKIKMSVGDRIKCLEFVSETGNVKDGRRMGLFFCHDCGETRELKICRVAKGAMNSCGCGSPVHQYNSNRGSYGDDYPAYVLWKRVETRCNNSHLDFQLDISDIREQWNKQNGKCFYTDIPIPLANNFTEIYEHNMASVDRIDSSVGYTKGNIQLTTKDINFMKQSLSDEEFIRLCTLVAIKHGNLKGTNYEAEVSQN